MYNLIISLIVIAAVLVTLLVLVQNSKGGGLASGFASGNQVMGAPKTADFLEKATWGLIGIIALLSVFAVGVRKADTNKGNDEVVIENAQEAAEQSAAVNTEAFATDEEAAPAAEEAAPVAEEAE